MFSCYIQLEGLGRLPSLWKTQHMTWLLALPSSSPVLTILGQTQHLAWVSLVVFPVAVRQPGFPFRAKQAELSIGLIEDLKQKILRGT